MKKILYIFLTATMGFYSCNMLEVEPTTQISAEEALADQKGLNASLTGAFDQLQSASIAQDLIVFGDLAADNLIHIGTKKEYRQVSDQYITPDNAYISGFWNSCYDGINRVNNILDKLPEVEGISDEDYKSAEADCRFLRAFNYFVLVNYFDGVPIKDQPTSGISADELNVARNTRAETYDFIITDLELAAELNPADAKIKALLARAYLYNQMWDKAAATALDVINNYNYQLVETADFGILFDESQSNTEVIFEIDFYNDDEVNAIADYFMPDGRFELAAWETTDRIVSLADAYPLPDERYYSTIDKITLQGQTEFYCTKYTDVATDKDNVILLRLAEMYLIRAEALNEIAYVPNGEAFDLVNTIRVRANLAPLTAGNAPGKDQFRRAVIDERRLEFAFEGHRFLDLKRTGLIDQILPDLGTLKSNGWLFPIPQTEMDTNEAMIQNGNY